MFLSVGRLGATPCTVVNSSSYAKSTTDKWKAVAAGKDSSHYDANCNCFKEGYRPEQKFTVYGVTPGAAESVYRPGSNWLVCAKPAPCPACKKCATCPPTPKCPVCSPSPSGGSNLPATSAPAKVDDGAYGPTLGILLAVAILGGGGYFAWSKLRKKGRK